MQGTLSVQIKGIPFDQIVTLWWLVEGSGGVDDRTEVGVLGDKVMFFMRRVWMGCDQADDHHQRHQHLCHSLQEKCYCYRETEIVRALQLPSTNYLRVSFWTFTVSSLCEVSRVSDALLAALPSIYSGSPQLSQGVFAKCLQWYFTVQNWGRRLSLKPCFYDATKHCPCKHDCKASWHIHPRTLSRGNISSHERIIHTTGDKQYTLYSHFSHMVFRR